MYLYRPSRRWASNRSSLSGHPIRRRRETLHGGAVGTTINDVLRTFSQEISYICSQYWTDTPWSDSVQRFYAEVFSSQSPQLPSLSEPDGRQQFAALLEKGGPFDLQKATKVFDKFFNIVNLQVLSCTSTRTGWETADTTLHIKFGDSSRILVTKGHATPFPVTWKAMPCMAYLAVDPKDDYFYRLRPAEHNIVFDRESKQLAIIFKCTEGSRRPISPIGVLGSPQSVQVEAFLVKVLVTWKGPSKEYMNILKEMSPEQRSGDEP